jgi:23S rRNA pseudouridine1911/1915/1917 synthase
MIEEQTFTAEEKERGQRLDCALLGRFPSSSRAFCKQAVDWGGVLVNGKPALKGSKLRLGDTVRVLKLKETNDNRVRPNQNIAVPILFEDDALIAVDKPAGLAVQPLTCEEGGTLMNGLVARYPELAAVGDQPLMAGALHRIDANTSGLVLAARTDAAFADMRAQFAARAVKKVYLALVQGQVALGGHLANDLAHQPDCTVCKMVDAQTLGGGAKAMHAETDYKPVEWLGNYTLLEVTIFTGVTHQIRAQLSLAGMPIVNDTLYGAKPVRGEMRHFLHAASASFTHPTLRQPCSIEAPLTEDFEAFLACRRAESSDGGNRDF